MRGQPDPTRFNALDVRAGDERPAAEMMQTDQAELREPVPTRFMERDGGGADRIVMHRRLGRRRRGAFLGLYKTGKALDPFASGAETQLFQDRWDGAVQRHHLRPPLKERERRPEGSPELPSIPVRDSVKPSLAGLYCRAANRRQAFLRCAPAAHEKPEHCREHIARPAKAALIWVPLLPPVFEHKLSEQQILTRDAPQGGICRASRP
jgi:hypothetical protein